MARKTRDVSTRTAVDGTAVNCIMLAIMSSVIIMMTPHVHYAHVYSKRPVLHCKVLLSGTRCGKLLV